MSWCFVGWYLVIDQTEYSLWCSKSNRFPVRAGGRWRFGRSIHGVAAGGRRSSRAPECRVKFKSVVWLPADEHGYAGLWNERKFRCRTESENFVEFSVLFGVVPDLSSLISVGDSNALTGVYLLGTCPGRPSPVRTTLLRTNSFGPNLSSSHFLYAPFPFCLSNVWEQWKPVFLVCSPPAQCD